MNKSHTNHIRYNDIYPKGTNKEYTYVVTRWGGVMSMSKFNIVKQYFCADKNKYDELIKQIKVQNTTETTILAVMILVILASAIFSFGTATAVTVPAAMAVVVGPTLSYSFVAAVSLQLALFTVESTSTTW
jgi:hypothetical protein